MTTIAAFVDRQGRAAIASDTSVHSAGWLKNGPAKVRRVGDVLLGWSGMIACFRFLRDVPEVEPNRAGIEKLADDWIAWLKGRGVGKVADDGGWTVPASFVAVTDGRIFTVDGGGGVAELNDRYWAIGAGGATALGVLWLIDAGTTEFAPGDKQAHLAVTAAIQAAALHDPYTNDDVVVFPLEASR